MSRGPSNDSPCGFEETHAELRSIAVRGFGSISADLLAMHVISVTRGADWPVRRAAMDALMRRWKFAERDELGVTGKPAAGPLGLYATGPAGKRSARDKRAGRRKRRGKVASRPYTTLLRSVVPIAGSCDCPDFLRSSLGLCKHLLVVLDDVSASEARLVEAVSEGFQESRAAVELVWDPVRSLHGEGDRLMGLRWIEKIDAPLSAALGRLRQCFVDGDESTKRRSRSKTTRGQLAAPDVTGANGSLESASSTHDADADDPNALARAVDALELASPKSGRRRSARAIVPRILRSGSARRDPSEGRRMLVLDPHQAADPEWRRVLLRELSRVGKPLAVAGPRELAVDPAAEALFREELERIERSLRAREAVPDLLRHLKGLSRKLYPYQLEGVRRLFETERLLLADDMGLGKTTQAVAACHALFHSRRARRGLLIVPAALKSQWVREWQATSPVPVRAVEGRPEERARIYRARRPGFLVIGYEQLLRDLALVHELDPDVVVLDEAQRIKNWATKSAVFVKSLAPRYRLVLTGTPMENRFEELASLLDWIDDVALAPKWRLEPWHTISEGDGRGGKSGARNLDTLRARLAPSVLRRVRRDVLAQLPSRTDTRVPVAMTTEQRIEHDELIQPIASLVATAARRPLKQAEFLRLMSLLTTQRILSNGLAQARFEELWPALSRSRAEPALLEGLLAPKLFEVRRLVQDLVLDQGRKIVVFSQWRRMLTLSAWSVSDLLADAGMRAVFFTGAESARVRTQSVVDFHDDPSAAVMFLSDAGGVGLNLQRAANACINLELPWNPAVLEQRIGRIYRLGQKDPIDVFNLVTEYGIEARIAELIAGKKAIFSGLFDGTTDTVRFEGKASFLADVEKLVAPLPDLPERSADSAALDDDDDLLLGMDDASLLSEGGTGNGEALVPMKADVVSPPAATVEGSDRSGAVVEAQVAGEPSNGEAGGTHLPDADGMRRLLSQLQVQRSDSGGIRIEAPPEAAQSLVTLLEGMARLVASGTGRGVGR